MPPANVYSVSQVSAYIKSLFVSVLIAAFVVQGGETKWGGRATADCVRHPGAGVPFRAGVILDATIH